MFAGYLDRGLNLTEYDDETRGLLRMLSRALSKSTDLDTAPVEQRTPSPEPIVGMVAPPSPPKLPGADAQEADVRGLGTPPTELRSTTQHSPVKPRTLTGDEVRSLILESLGQIPNFPKRGVAVTVYGFRPWNAMLNFAPRSTSHSEALVFREALADIVRELRPQVEVDIEGN
jgi:hypothetical protein